MNEINLITNLVNILPNIVTALTQCDAIMREHEEQQATKYSEQEYLKAVLRLYQKRQISSSEAQKALKLIFKDTETITLDIEAQIMKLLK